MEGLKAWLNDKKNQPIIIGGFVVILLVVGFIYYKLMFAGSGGGEDYSAQPVSPPSDMAPAPDAPAPAPIATPSTPVDAGGQPAPSPQDASAQTASAAPLETSRPDPFAPNFGPTPKRTKMIFTHKLQKPDIRRVAPVLPEVVRAEVAAETLPPQPRRRMAGLLKNGQIFAIIETAGPSGTSSTTMVVRPGDTLDADVAVDRILPDRVILKSTRTKSPIFLEIPRSATPLTQADQPGTGTGTGVGGTRTPGVPDGGRRPGGAPMAAP